jgi:flagellar protein FlbT
MKNTLRLSLRPNEKLYVNGAVIRVDRKVASTPLRQLYFILQVMLMNPQGADEAREMFRRSLPLLLAGFEDERIRAGLKQVDRMVGEDHVYEALKAIRALYPLERLALEAGTDHQEGAPRPAAAGAI